jgi:hypothetical protein
VRPDYKVDVHMCNWQRQALDPIDGSGLPNIDFKANVDGSYWSPDVDNYYAEIQVAYDLNGKVCRVFIQPMGKIKDPEEEQDQPIPYEVTDLGRQQVELNNKLYRIASRLVPRIPEE